MNKKEFYDMYFQDPKNSLLKEYKVDNAVILAAGFSARFQPLSQICPKGLLPVHGEALLERQIRQLKEAGISDISIVVGYKKELFIPIAEKWKVTLIENKEYKEKNNVSSLYAVKELLKNTYICCSDNYFPVNPFHSHEFCGFYSANYAEGQTSEYCLKADAEGNIISVEIGGADSWYMCGHAYFDRQFSASYRRFLEQEYHLPETGTLYWENVYMKHLDALTLSLKGYKPNEILEFDNLEELRLFDSYYAEHSVSELIQFLQNIYSTK